MNDFITDLNELDKLEDYLRKSGDVYERIDELYDLNNPYMRERHQLIVYEQKKNGRMYRSWDAICQPGSYGHSKGLLEVYGTI